MAERECSCKISTLELILEEIIVALLANAAFRATVEGIVVKVVADIFHRRATDPNFLQASDTVFAALAVAKTQEDLTNAQNSLRTLMASAPK
jgi:hypothetical protein